MSTHQVAEKLVQYCREGKNIDAINELYADDVISLEPKGSPAAYQTEGKEAVLEKNRHWYSTVQEIHSGEVSEPIVSGDFFTVAMHMDVTYKEGGRMPMQELAVYEVKDEKIVGEQFFYSM